MGSNKDITISRQQYEQFLQNQAEAEQLRHELAQLKRMLFGAKSERYVPADPGRGSLFEVPAQEQEPSTEKVSYTREKSQGNKQPVRSELPSHLPRREEVIEPEGLPEGARQIGESVTELLEYEPASLYVRRIVRPRYVIASTDERTDIVIAPLPSLPIARDNAGAGVLAHITVSKFVDHLPFYRQAQMLKRQKLDLAESTLGGWFSQMCRTIAPLGESLMNKVLASDYLMADESPIPVLTNDKPGATHKGYMWVYCDPVKRLVLFDYRKSRSREGPDQMLKDFKGFLQTDGYNAYDKLSNKAHNTQLACMAHARRKFEQAKDNDPVRAGQALKQFAALYTMERQAREQELDEQQVYELRQTQVLPLLEQLKTWLDENLMEVAPKSAIGKAMAYTLNLWTRLIRYTEQGRFHIDNNLIENSIRPLALGRKNYLFVGSHQAAENAALIYSLLATAKLQGVEPYAWLRDTLNRIHDHPADKLRELLPIKH